MASTYIKLPLASSVSAGVASFNGRTGAVTPQTGDYDISQITGGQPSINGNYGNNSVLGTDSAGDLQAIPGWVSDTDSGGLNIFRELQPDDNNQAFFMNRVGLNLDPLQDSPNDSYILENVSANIDVNSSGFDIGTNGNSVILRNGNITHNGTSDIGTISGSLTSINIGNGTDPITLNGIIVSSFFGQVENEVTISGQLRGYGLELHLDDDVTLQQGSTVFFNFSNIDCPANGWNEMLASPNIASIMNNTNYVGVQMNPNIPEFTGNAGFFGFIANGILGDFDTGGYTGFAVNPNIGIMNTGGFFGVNVAPNIDETHNAIGLNVDMSQVTVFAGVKASLVEQDLTFTAESVGTDYNAVTIEYTAGGTAGAEVVSVAGAVIEVQIESGVSTATQIKAALDADFSAALLIDVSISGTGSDPQVVFGPTNLANGENQGNKQAANFNGDVFIQGNLNFSGALSIGKLNAFASQTIVSGGGAPASVHGLVSNPTIAASTTVTNADTIGVNTAMLLVMGDNSSVSTGFLGMAALALPAVVSMGTGATVDKVSGATFALSLDATATGGTIDQLTLCRAITVPNSGITTVTRQYGYEFALPFGDAATTSWAFYTPENVHNYFAGNLLIGGTPISADTVANASVALEIASTTKALLNARMTTTQRDALTAINGMQIYNTTDDKLQVRAAGAWVNLH